MSLFDVGLINGLLDSGTRELNKVPDYKDSYEIDVESKSNQEVIQEDSKEKQIQIESEKVEKLEPQVEDTLGTTTEPQADNEFIKTFEEPISYPRKKKNGRLKKLLNRKF